GPGLSAVCRAGDQAVPRPCGRVDQDTAIQRALIIKSDGSRWRTQYLRPRRSAVGGEKRSFERTCSEPDRVARIDCKCAYRLVGECRARRPGFSAVRGTQYTLTRP